MRRARDKLIDQYLDHPDVSLIDIGYAPARQGKEVVLRVHVSEQWFNLPTEERLSFPDLVEGIPVTVIPGDYRVAE